MGEEERKREKEGVNTLAQMVEKAPLSVYFQNLVEAIGLLSKAYSSAQEKVHPVFLRW